MLDLVPAAPEVRAHECLAAMEEHPCDLYLDADQGEPAANLGSGEEFGIGDHTASTAEP
jgi:hypothetical protein